MTSIVSPATTQTDLLTVSGLKKYYPVRGGILLREKAKVYAVDDVSLTIESGKTLGLVGESGCGKSTVAKTLMLLHPPTAGRIIFDGYDVTQLSKAEQKRWRADMQMVFQDPAESLNSRSTVHNLLREPFMIHHEGDRQTQDARIDELLQQVGLNASALNRFPHEFSGGQKQRIGIARAIALKPKLVVCDEPVSALDVSIQSQIINLLLTLQQELGLALLFIAHDLAVVKHVSDTIAVMYLGQIVEYTQAKTLYAEPLQPYTQSLISAIPVADPVVKTDYQILQGDVPSPINPPSGCRFHTRCPKARPDCADAEPQLEEVKPGHWVRCFYWDN